METRITNFEYDSCVFTFKTSEYFCVIGTAENLDFFRTYSFTRFLKLFGTELYELVQNREFRATSEKKLKHSNVGVKDYTVKVRKKVIFSQ